MDLRLCFLFVFTGLFMFIKGQCNGATDLIIAVPSGWNIPDSEFNVFEEHLISLMDYFNIHPSHFNIGLLRYGNNPIVYSAPQPFKSRPQVNTRITLLSQRTAADGRELDVAKAILEMDRMAHTPSKFFPYSILRSNARKFGIIFTYKDTTDHQRVADAARLAKANGMLIHAIRATGNGSEHPYGPNFQVTGSDYCRLFSMSSFATGMPYLIPDLARTICSEIDPTVQVTDRNCRPGLYPKVGPLNVTCSRINNMVQADPNNCAYFYRCDFFNSQPLRLKCPSYTLYDPYSFVCNYANDVACYSDLQCPTNIPQLYPHPTDCHRYINCDNDYIPHVQSCPYDKMFDPVWQTCNNTAEITCILPRM